MVLDIILDALRNSVLISGLVVIIMMMIECLNIESHGRLFLRLKESRIGQVVFSTFLGAIPGCMGGFASVSLYTHGMISFGALVAMMIASSGDEAFVMLAMFPKDSLWIFLLLFVIAIVTGLVVDFIRKPATPTAYCEENFSIHDADRCHHSDDCDSPEHHHGRHFTWKRLVMFLGVAVFITALVTGHLEHGHEEGESLEGGINLLSEEWMNWMFAALSLFVLAVLVFASDHFVDEHLWHHVTARHLPRIFAWTFSILLILGFGLHYLDISGWISDNTALMILMATLIGIIPESGPHMIFVTLYAAGIVPLPVLLASCISQDGHASLPLIAESKTDFLKAKIINCIVALAAGFTSMLLIG